MPLYEFKCEECGNETFKVLSMEKRKEPLSVPCEKCEGRILRIYSHGGFVDPGIINADKNMERSGVQSALERIRDHSGRKMNWKG